MATNPWHKITRHPGLTKEQENVYRNFNILVIFGIFDVIVIGLALKDIEPRWPFYMCIAQLFAFSGLLIFHMNGLFKISRYITFLVGLVLQAMASLTHGAESGFDYIFLVIGVLPMLFFDERRYYGSLFALSMASMLGIRYLSQTIDPIVVLPSSIPLYWNMFFCGTAIFFVIHIFKQGYIRHQRELNEQYRLISAQKEEIEGINNNLEGIVNERTYKIKLQESRFRELAFLNAHRARGPLARILGLLNLAHLESDKQQSFKQFLPVLKENAEELDTVLREVNSTLEQADTASSLIKS